MWMRKKKKRKKDFKIHKSRRVVHTQTGTTTWRSTLTQDVQFKIFDDLRKGQNKCYSEF